MRRIHSKVLANRKIAPLQYSLILEAPTIAREIRPGQFLHIRCSDTLDPLLRRPFSIHRLGRRTVEILYKVVGRGSEILSKRKTGEYIDVIGPLGNGFDLRQITNRAASTGKRTPLAGRHQPQIAILVAGGMGVAPLVALAGELMKLRTRESTSSRNAEKVGIYALIGAKTRNQVLCEREFKGLGCRALVSTNDGSQGRKGLVTDILEDFLCTIRYLLNANIYACGPEPMLKRVSRLARRHNLRCQVSLEERMACGIGVCLGCPVKVKRNCAAPALPAREGAGRHEYKMVCKDGPVFDSEEIVWE